MLTLSDKVNVEVKVMVTLYVCEHNLSPVHCGMDNFYILKCL